MHLPPFTWYVVNEASVDVGFGKGNLVTSHGRGRGPRRLPVGTSTRARCIAAQALLVSSMSIRSQGRTVSAAVRAWLGGPLRL